MLIVVPVKQVPDLVEELEVAADGRSLDPDAVKFVMNEFDDHALEEALQLKEARGGDAEVLALALDFAEADQVLYTCLAKGADRAARIQGPFEAPVSSHVAARALASVLRQLRPDLVLTGVQAIDDLDGQMGPLLATYLGLPHVSVATRLALADDGGSIAVQQEYGAGVTAELEVSLPAVLGVQAARVTPRYASVSRVRQLMRSAELERFDAGPLAQDDGAELVRLFKPAASTHASMLPGSADDVAEALARLIRERGLVKV